MGSTATYDSSRCTFVGHAYWRSLGRPWKLVTFGVATTALVGLAPYAGDPTWDAANASIMALLTFLTAPWALGTLYRRLRGIGTSTWDQAALAVCLWLLSTSWSQDAYLLWRDGHYAVTWYANFLVSSVLYVCAGLFWSLDWRPKRGTTFSFTAEHWPMLGTAPFYRIALPASVLMVLVVAFVAAFLPR